ncbi:hypothetical protein FRC11_011357, partial [Ceratobasidium sp. 423]
TAAEVFNCLVKEHGCLDISSELTSWTSNPPTPCAGGGFGDVYKGTNKAGSAISIKCLRLHANSGSEPKQSKRAGRELYNWFKARHRNVLELNGIALFNGQIAMISPWMDNGNLREYVKSYPQASRWELCTQITEGLAHIHGIGMVHGDIKAVGIQFYQLFNALNLRLNKTNVLMSNHGIVKIGDFGNSILEECSLRCTATTNVGGGTIRWMAWELFDQPDPPVGKSIMTDVHSLAMTILEVVTGEDPYAECRSLGAVMGALFKRRLPNRPNELASHQQWGDER